MFFLKKKNVEAAVLTSLYSSAPPPWSNKKLTFLLFINNFLLFILFIFLKKYVSNKVFPTYNTFSNNLTTLRWNSPWLPSYVAHESSCSCTHGGSRPRPWNPTACGRTTQPTGLVHGSMPSSHSFPPKATFCHVGGRALPTTMHSNNYGDEQRAQRITGMKWDAPRPLVFGCPYPSCLSTKHGTKWDRSILSHSIPTTKHMLTARLVSKIFPKKILFI